MNKVERAIISVTDKTGIVELAKSLDNLGVQILSTGGTAKAIRDGGVSVTDIFSCGIKGLRGPKPSRHIMYWIRIWHHT